MQTQQPDPSLMKQTIALCLLNLKELLNLLKNKNLSVACLSACQADNTITISCLFTKGVVQLLFVETQAVHVWAIHKKKPGVMQDFFKEYFFEKHFRHLYQQHRQMLTGSVQLIVPTSLGHISHIMSRGYYLFWLQQI